MLSGAETAGGDRALGPNVLSLTPFAIDSQATGMMLVRGGVEQHIAPESREIYDSLAELVGTAVALQHAFRENSARARESKTLSRVSRLVATASAPVDAVLQRVAEILPRAYPEARGAVARVTVDGCEHGSSGDWSDRRCVAREIRVAGQVRGTVELAFCALLGADEPSEADVGRVLGETARHVASLLLRAELEEEKSTHSMLRHSERLATISTLASNLAHDLNDPLATVSGFAELLKKEPEISERGRSDLARISAASHHAQDIVRCLLLLARRSASSHRMLSLNRVVEEALSLVEHRCLERNVAVEARLDGQLPRIHGDPVQLCQVVINLMRNAVQAMPGGGRLTLSTATENEHVTLAVEDTGVGMSDEIRARIFDPFFTTKDASDGTGLGLAIVQDVVSLHGGDVEVQTGRGAGTRMVVRLPLGQTGQPDGPAEADGRS
jgi:signal transduction histidine kinase